MIKKELTLILDEEIKTRTVSAQENSSDGETLIKKGIEIIILKSFLETVKKEKAFNLKIKNEVFVGVLTDTVHDISEDLSKHLFTLVDMSSLPGLNIIKEELNNSRKNKKGKRGNKCINY